MSWGVASAHPKRLASLTIMSRPHPKSFQRALAKEDGDQKNRSKHHRAFLDDGTGRMLLDNARRLRTGLFGQGVPAAAMDEHLSVLGNSAAMEAALAWYRANKGLAADIGTIEVPTLYIWGGVDATVGPSRRAWHGRVRELRSPWKCCRASAISSWTRRLPRLRNCCWRTSGSIRSEAPTLSPCRFG